MLGDGLGRRLAEEFFSKLAVEQALGKPVGAEEEFVTGLEVNGTDLRGYKLDDFWVP